MKVSLPRPQTDVKILEGDSLQDRFRALEMSPVSRTKALQGEVNGAAAFLNHPIQSEHQDRVTLHYKTTTRLDMISQTLLHEGVSPSVINTTTATHVIIAVSYGAQAFFVFDHWLNNSEKTAEMKDVIKKLCTSFCASQTSSSLNDNEKAMSLLYNCSLYIDVGDWKSPVSFDKAVKIYDSLPELLGSQGEKAVPLKVWLYPLKKLERTSVCAALSGVNASFTQRAGNILEHLNKQIKKCQDFMTSTDNLSVIIWFPALKDKLVDFSELLQKYKADCQRGITEIKNSEAKVEEGEKKLRHFIETHDRSPFSADNINQWLENKETELKILNDCKAADITVVKSQSELHQIINDPQINRVMCFTLTSPDDEDSFLTALKHHIESDHITPTYSLQSKPVQINQKVLIDLQLYIAAKEANEDTEQTRFIAASVPDDEFPEFTVQFYYAGMIVSRNMKFGVKPDLAQITQIKHNSVSVKWNHSQKKSIERFVVEYIVVGDDGMNNNTWKQITVYNHTFKEECVISSLKPDTEYQLRYAVCDNNSMSSFSWFIYFQTSSVTRPGRPSVAKLSRDTLRLTWLKAEADEDCPVLQYMVEYREAGLEGWSSVLTQGSECECTLTEPHSTCYRVRVSAVYENITSKPSEETSVPVDVWIINLSRRKTSILLEVLKLQTEKKPVELIDCTDDESEVRGFIQCLPYISQLRNAEEYIPSLCKVFGPKVNRDEVTPLLQALGFTVTLSEKLPSSTCRCVGRVLSLSSSKLNLTLKSQAISPEGVTLLFRHITHLQTLSLEDRMVMMMIKALRSCNGRSSLIIEELSLITKDSKQNHCRIVSSLTSLLRRLSVQRLDLTECKIDAVSVTAVLCLQGLQTIRLSKETLQQLVSVVYEAQDDELTRCFLKKVSEDLTSCSLTWEVIQYLLQHQPLQLKLDLRKSEISCEKIRKLVPCLDRIQLKRLTPSFILSIIMEIYESRSPQFVSGLLSSAENDINLKNKVLNSDQCSALCFTLQHCNTVKLNLFWTSIPEEELKRLLPLLNRVTQLSVDRQLLLKLLHCCSSSDDQQEAANLLLSALQYRLDFSSSSILDLTVTQEIENHLTLTIDDCRIISSVLQKTKSVVKLVLVDCEVSDSALKQILPVLSQVQLSCGKALLLQFLACISKRTKKGSLRCVQALSRALGGEVDLSHSQMDQRSCEQLSVFLEYSDGLTELDLSHCRLTDQYMNPLLPHLHKTQTLDLSQNNITDELAKKIHTVVSTHDNIQTVRLFGNKIRDKQQFTRVKQIEMW
nr:uncharacterized protein LOC129438509 isoform X1 [Misgurnus anguillicaudatus]